MTDQLYIDTLTEAEIARIEERLRPNQSSAGGFLGFDENLRDVINEDAQTLQDLGITYVQLADTLEYIVTHPDDDHGFMVSTKTYKGHQEDPFQDDSTVPPYSHMDFTITNKYGDSITFSGLLITLIRDYQFFEGKDVPYRLDPADAVRVLQLSSKCNSYKETFFKYNVDDDLLVA